MTPSEETLIYVRGIVAGLPEQDQVRIKEYAEKLRAVVIECGPLGNIALALLGAELAVV